jgi:hypothetical protein
MKAYSVEWLPEASDALALLWLQATNRQAITSAQADIDDALARNPFTSGHHVSEGLYRMVAQPLVVAYSVDTRSKKVKVSHVWLLP